MSENILGGGFNKNQKGFEILPQRRREGKQYGLQLPQIHHGAYLRIGTSSHFQIFENNEIS